MFSFSSSKTATKIAPTSGAKKLVMSGGIQTVAQKRGAVVAEALSLVIDIESGLVRAALVANAQGAAPHVMYTVSAPIVNRPAKTHGGDLLGSMAKALKEVTTIVANKAIPEIRSRGVSLPISKIHCALSSPWIISKTKTVKVDYGKDVEISKEMINKIIDAEHQEMEKKFKAEHDATSAGAALEYDLVFIEQKIFEIKLNGYPVTHFQGRRAREVEVSFAVTVSSKDILARIHDTIAGNLNVVSIRGIYGVKGDYVEEFHSSLLLQYAAFRSLVKVRSDYIAAHVHNDLSDIIVVRRGVCSILASFPFGMSSFVKKSSYALNQSEPLTSSALSMKSSQKLTPDSEKAVADASDPIIREWAAQFFKTLSSAEDSESLPGMLVLTVHDHFPYFKQALKAEERGSSLDITALDEVLLEKAVSYERGQDSNALVTMYAFALNPEMHADLK
jgi:hypothetical protein